MNTKDFKITKNLKGEKFCSSCFKENPDSDKGYSLCCHEDVVNKETAIKFSKRRDITIFLKDTYKEVKEFGNLFFNNNAIFSFENRLVCINITKSEDEIIEELKCKI
jgi:hypothetical protein